MCHATPYASRQKLNTDIGIIQLATRISDSGIQRRPRMTTQGNRLDVRTRKLSPLSSFRADHDSGSSGFSTPTSSRSLVPIAYTLSGVGSCCTSAPVIVTGAQVNGHGLANQQRTQVVLFFWFGWGGVVPPLGGGTTIASTRSSVPLAGASVCPRGVCVHIDTAWIPGATPCGAFSERMYS